MSDCISGDFFHGQAISHKRREENERFLTTYWSSMYLCNNGIKPNSQSWRENAPIQAPSLLFFVMAKCVKVHIFKIGFATRIYKMFSILAILHKCKKKSHYILYNCFKYISNISFHGLLSLSIYLGKYRSGELWTWKAEWKKTNLNRRK